MEKKIFFKAVLVVCTFLMSHDAFSRVIILNVKNIPNGMMYERTENVVVGDVIRWVNNLNETVTNSTHSYMGGKVAFILHGPNQVYVNNLAPGGYYDYTITTTAYSEIRFFYTNYNSANTLGESGLNTINLNFSTLGVNDSENVKLKTQIYPNPCFDFLKVTSNEAIKSLELLDSTGRLLYTKQIEGSRKLEENIDMSLYDSGKYILKVRNDKNINTINVIKK